MCWVCCVDSALNWDVSFFFCWCALEDRHTLCTQRHFVDTNTTQKTQSEPFLATITHKSFEFVFPVQTPAYRRTSPLTQRGGSLNINLFNIVSAL